MSIILGLDVSTSCTGVCVIDSSIQPDSAGSHIVILDRIEFPKCETLWEKADVVGSYLSSLKLGGVPRDYAKFNSERRYASYIDRIVVEEPLMGFRTGMSSAQTITQLMRFNGIVSYIARNVYEIEPEYISSSHARKLCGIKLQKTAVGGPQKEQVFAYMQASDLACITWPLKKSGKMVEWSRDACDAYVIARAASVEGIIEPVKKIKKRKKTV